MRPNRKIINAIVLSLVLVAACKDATLQSVSNQLNVIAKSMKTLHETVVSANENHLISNDDTAKIMLMEIQVNQAGRDAVAATKQIAQLSPTDKAKILGIIKPIFAVIGNEVLASNAIKDVNTRQQVQLLLIATQTAMNTINATLQ